ncbi:DUF881 domain-containing protein [Kineococcus gynurae]|uniref:DUF881 domain-containing protein n=1 Tax=Kineococcus gynurae TaxID=452979 RepID=A0ABV5LSX7_9ACTN
MAWSASRVASRVAVVAVLAAGGLLFATSAQTSHGTNLRTDSGDLGDLIRERSQQVEAQAAEVSRLRGEVETLTARVGGDPAPDAAAQRLAAAAGTEAVTGPGVRVTLDDAPRGELRPAGAAPDDLVVHQQDLEAVINALWASGAEAVEVMDQRLVSTSAVRCVGSVLILQGRTYSPPYTVSAIGDPARLQTGLEDSSSVAVYRQYVAAYGLGYEVQTSTDLTFPAFDGPLDLEYVRSDS